jgi:hypothetical protein
VEQVGQGGERTDAGGRLRRGQRDRAQDLLARGLRGSPHEAQRIEPVQQLHHPCLLVGGHRGDQLLDRTVDTLIGGRTRPEAVGVVLALDARHHRVAQRLQRRSAGLGEVDHRASFLLPGAAYPGESRTSPHTLLAGSRPAWSPSSDRAA